MSQERPVWANQRTIRDLYGISEHRLVDLVTSGVVRSAKFGSTRQAGRLYCVIDLENALNNLARGHTLHRAPRLRYRPSQHVRRRVPGT